MLSRFSSELAKVKKRIENERKVRDCIRNLDKCLKTLTTGDVLTVGKLDRLGRSLPHLVGVLESLKGQGVGFRSLTEAIDTESATGRLLGHISALCSADLRGERGRNTNAGRFPFVRAW